MRNQREHLLCDVQKSEGRAGHSFADVPLRVVIVIVAVVVAVQLTIAHTYIICNTHNINKTLICSLLFVRSTYTYYNIIYYVNGSKVISTYIVI